RRHRVSIVEKLSRAASGGAGGATSCRGVVQTGTWVTGVRTHRLHLLIAGGGLGEVNSGDSLMAVVGVPHRFSYLKEADRLAAEGLADEEAKAFELDPAVVLDAPHLEVDVVLDGRHDRGIRPWAGSVARCGDSDVQRSLC